MIGQTRKHNLEGCIAAERAPVTLETAVIKWRAEPANTPLVEQAHYGTCVCGSVFGGNKRAPIWRRKMGKGGPLERLSSFSGW